MKQKVYRELERLERTEAAALEARATRKGRSGTGMFRQILSRRSVELLPDESLAEALGRVSELGARGLKDLLWERVQTVAGTG